ncbi:MAG: hypothetical protein KBB32_09080 [Spirochaetia bacterium]|nr:hypothetical protein [Spirochaetia bacterium]
MTTTVGSKPRRRGLFSELQILTTLSAVVVIAVAEILSLTLSLELTRRQLVDTANNTADGIAAIIAEPLYTLDLDQATRIGNTLLSTGGIVGIRIDSADLGAVQAVTAGPETGILVELERNVSREGLPLGTVAIQFGSGELGRIRTRHLFSSIGVLIVVIGLSFLVARTIALRRVTDAFGRIMSDLDRIASGQYGQNVALCGYADMDRLIEAVNGMAAKIVSKNNELEALNHGLEARVLERSETLSRTFAQLTQTQDRLVAIEKMATLGQLAAGIAHELNTPLGAIVSAGSALRDYVGSLPDHVFGQYAALDQDGRHAFEDMARAAVERAAAMESGRLDRARRHAVAARLAGLGVTDSNQIGEFLVEFGLDGRLDDWAPYFQLPQAGEIFDLVRAVAEARRMAELVNVAAGKAGTVVGALRSHVHSGSQDLDAVVDVDATLDVVLVLAENRIKRGVTLERTRSGAKVRGSPDRLGQVWLNLIMNATQAMDGAGTLELATSTEDGRVSVTVADSGPGIPEDIQSRVFDPFFTTKTEGGGMGLGLELCRRIVESHGGNISFTSRPGRTVFSVVLPALETA